MVISEHPSKLSLPQTNPGVATVLEYLITKFPYIDAPIWQQRIADGKVHCHDGSLIKRAVHRARFFCYPVQQIVL